MFSAPKTPVVILTDGHFGTSVAKLATGVLRYGQWPVVAIVDSTQAGKTAAEVVSHLADTPVANTPIIAGLADLAALEKSPGYQPPKALILGTAPIGGKFPEHWYGILKTAIETHQLHLINGMHQFLNDDPELARLAMASGTKIWDVRNPDGYYENNHAYWNISQHKARPDFVKVITMVGSDCSVGKMFTALELSSQGKARGMHTSFVATGQTGIIIHGRGVPLDRVVADYMAGLMESAVFEAVNEKTTIETESNTVARAKAESSPVTADNPLFVFVEGQGSLLHPAYSGVTMGLLHGSRPDAMILCHNPSIGTIKGGYQTPLPDLKTLIRIYEEAASWTNGVGNTSPIYPHPKVVGISLNTSAMSQTEAKAAVERAKAETGLPATDPVRFGLDGILKQLSRHSRP
ncbi:MAG: DUF1611 domain-containing protein [Vampirovibrionales bacterium]|nr:DUF1611 domain-containing protein [Vampirovibrionales bacterium]